MTRGNFDFPDKVFEMAELFLRKLSVKIVFVWTNDLLSKPRQIVVAVGI